MGAPAAAAGKVALRLARSKRGRRIMLVAAASVPLAMFAGLCMLVTLVSPTAATADVPDDAATTAVHAYRAGFRGEGLVVAIAVAGAESNFSDEAVGVNPPDPQAAHPCGRSGSRDRGRWQINDCYHPEVTDACAFEVSCAAAAAYRISAGGTVWVSWATYNAGAHLEYDAIARAAAALAPAGALATIVGANALPLPRELLGEQMIRARHWDGKVAWDGPVPAGTPVFAMEAGTVVVAHDELCGIGLTIVATSGHRDLYCHGSALVVADNATVATGQQIMVSGSTGERVTGPHLHLQVEVAGRRVCPQQMLLAWYQGLAFSPLRATGAC